jgi:hypothetical protein
MQSIKGLLISAVVAALIVGGVAVAQLPDQKQGPLRGLARPSPISVDDIVERIMAFDKNKDGKVTKDELPERMHHLIAEGDLNKDGALDKEEVKKLVTKLTTARGGFGRVEIRGGFRAGPGPGAGFRGFDAGFRGFDVGFGPGAIEGVVDDLKLSAKKKAQAMAAVKSHEENVRKLMAQERARLLQKMKKILSAEEFKDFEAALDRPRGATVIVGPPPGPR